MKNPTVTEIDRATDQWVAYFAVLVLIAAAAAQRWPAAAVALIFAIALAVVIVANRLDKRKAEAEIKDWTDSDCHLADIANSDVERA